MSTLLVCIRQKYEQAKLLFIWNYISCLQSELFMIALFRPHWYCDDATLRSKQSTSCASYISHHEYMLTLSRKSMQHIEQQATNFIHVNIISFGCG
jgi:hypothetical protein